jgi:hypothetical protein
MQILSRLRTAWHTAIAIAMLSAITSCNALDVSGLDLLSSHLTGIGVSGGIVEVGDTVRLDAMGSVDGILGLFSYDPVLDAKWSISDPGIARLETLPPPPPADSFPRAQVLVHGLQPGNVTVSAKARGISGFAEVRVIHRIDHIDVRILRDTLFVGDTIPISTTIVGSNGIPITGLLPTFETSSGVQLIGYADGPRVAAIASGPATVKARFRRAEGTLNLTVLAR